MSIIDVSSEQRLWEEFLQKNTHLIFHTPLYQQFIEKAFGVKYSVLGVVEAGEIKVILPVMEVHSSLFGNKMISTAYLEYGGFAGDLAYVSSLLDHIDKSYSKDYDYLEIRGGLEKFDGVLSENLQKALLYKRFVLSLDGDVWQGIQKSKRKAINKSLKNVDVRELSAKDIDEFYLLYLHNMRSFGSPPYSQNYFVQFFSLVEKGYAKAFASFYQGKMVSALLGFCYGDRVHILIAVSNQEFQELRPNDAMHWKYIDFAKAQGYRWFDFGRVREESGQFEYKQKWGGTLMELPSYFLLWKAKEVPVVDPAKYSLLVKIWKRLPLAVTKMVGMKLRRELGI